MKFKKILAAFAAAGGGLTIALAGSAVPAVAATGTYGYDNNAHIVVGGGSDTTYKAMTALSAIYNTASIAGCVTQTSATGANQSPQLNQCSPSSQLPTGLNANFERDTTAQASPTGSSAGIASLNSDASIGGNDAPGAYPYQGTSSAGQKVDFARSSRAFKSTGGNCVGGNELTCDTFWGFAEDGVEVFGFGSHGGVDLTPNQIFKIYSCAPDARTWGQVLGTSDPAPIVPWGMNPASGTFATFNSYLQGPGGGTSGFTVDDNLSKNPYPTPPGCVRQLSTNTPPFENDVKPLFNDVQNNQGGIKSDGGVNDPSNWLWFGSFGLLSAFPYDNTYTTPDGTLSFTGNPDSINGSLPSTGSISGKTYPIIRTLYHVTPKASADCPTTTGACDFNGNPGPMVTGSDGTTQVSDLNVNGASGGTAGAVREFTRFLCRVNGSQQPVDPYTGVNLFTEIAAAKTASGFTAVPTTLRTPGSSCAVNH